MAELEHVLYNLDSKIPNGEPITSLGKLFQWLITHIVTNFCFISSLNFSGFTTESCYAFVYLSKSMPDTFSRFRSLYSIGYDQVVLLTFFNKPNRLSPVSIPLRFLSSVGKGSWDCLPAAPQSACCSCLLVFHNPILVTLQHLKCDSELLLLLSQGRCCDRMNCLLLY